MADESTKRSEPQSYGSEQGWLEGRTGQTVEDTPSRASRHDEDQYESRHSDEPTVAQAPEDAEMRPEYLGAADTSAVPTVNEVVTKISTSSNDRRKSFFRDRDYR